MNKECAPQACLQNEKQCFVSYSEQVEAANICNTLITFLPHEIILPKQFCFPFVNKQEDFFFTTIMQHPINRLKTVLCCHGNKRTLLWLSDKLPSNNPYVIDSLSVQGLAGVRNNQQITEENLTLAKCQLELMDLVITDKAHTASMIQVVGPLWGWKECQKIF